MLPCAGLALGEGSRVVWALLAQHALGTAAVARVVEVGEAGQVFAA